MMEKYPIFYEKQLEAHVNSRPGPIEYIVVHDTGNKARGAGAKAHVNYFKTSDRKASADFIVDETGVYKINDYTKYYTWHCGDGHGRYGIKNSNSLGIEMCINSDNNLALTHNYTIMLIYDLMVELGIPASKVVRHYDASRKNCPMHLNYRAWTGWVNFKQGLMDYIALKNGTPIKDQEKSEIITVQVQDKNFKFTSYTKDQHYYVKARDILESMGYYVQYDSNQKKIIALKR